jgi:hypothetical protein
MVPGGGFEPPRPCGLRILSPLRLPISPSGQRDSYIITLTSITRHCQAPPSSRFPSLNFNRKWNRALMIRHESAGLFQVKGELQDESALTRASISALPRRQNAMCNPRPNTLHDRSSDKFPFYSSMAPTKKPAQRPALSFTFIFSRSTSKIVLRGRVPYNELEADLPFGIPG